MAVGVQEPAVLGELAEQLGAHRYDLYLGEVRDEYSSNGAA
jgi:hypothetical protein